MDENQHLEQALQILIDTLHKGNLPNQLSSDLSENERFQELLLNLDALRKFGLALSKGDLSQNLTIKGALAGSLKNLQATLIHLTWQTQVIAEGDFSQRVDFMGEFSIAFNQMVEHLEKARSELKQSEAVYRSMFENNRAVQLLVDGTSGLIVDANPAACNFYGYSHEELCRKSIIDIQLTPTEQISNFLQEIQSNDRNKPFIIPQKLANDEIRTVEIYSSPIEISQKTLLYSIVHNITERKLAEDSLQSRMREIEALQSELREQAIRDPLTGLYNRRYWKEIIDHEFKRAVRSHSPIGIMMLDIDHFKKVNDTYGHPMGDRVLVSLGKLLNNNIRGEDIACRFGGEEFIVLLPGATHEITFNKAESLRLKFQSLVVQNETHQIKSTISIGVAVFPDHGNNSQDLLSKVDHALYIAKNQGRNRVVVYS